MERLTLTPQASRTSSGFTSTLRLYRPTPNPAFPAHGSFQRERSISNIFVFCLCDKLLCLSPVWFINPFTKATVRALGTRVPSVCLLKVVSLCQRQIPPNYTPGPNPTQLCTAWAFGISEYYVCSMIGISTLLIRKAFILVRIFLSKVSIVKS